MENNIGLKHLHLSPIGKMHENNPFKTKRTPKNHTKGNTQKKKEKLEIEKRANLETEAGLLQGDDNSFDNIDSYNFDSSSNSSMSELPASKQVVVRPQKSFKKIGKRVIMAGRAITGINKDLDIRVVETLEGHENAKEAPKSGCTALDADLKIWLIWDLLILCSFLVYLLIIVDW